jgi:sulfur relay (sulfurtransferase) DsrC/TusE family protein
MSLLDSIKADGSVSNKDPKFPHAPADWTKELALKIARQEGPELGADHWEAVRALQEYYTKHQEIILSMRKLHDALDETSTVRAVSSTSIRFFWAGRWHRVAGLRDSRHRRGQPIKVSEV